MMDDYISRKAAIESVRRFYDDYIVFDNGISLEKLLKDLPAAPVREVVLCKDCKYYQFADNRAFGFPVKRCEWTGFEDVDDDDFCSRGERKDG